MLVRFIIIFSFMANVFCVLKLSLPAPRVVKILCSSRFFVLLFIFRSVVNFE